MNFLSHTTSSRALAASLHSKGVSKTAKELRRLIPAEVTISLLVRAAVTGLLPAYDEDGNEIGAASPVDTKTRIDTLRYLTGKRVPDPKAEDESGREFDLGSLPTTVKEAQELTPAELDAALEATFQVIQETPCPTPSPAPSTTTSPGATVGSSSPPTPAATPPQSDPFPFLGKLRQKPTGDSASTTPSTSNG